MRQRKKTAPLPDCPTNDTQLAARLGTNPKSLRRWRQHFGADCPATRDLAQWQAFMEENRLGPFSAQRIGTAPPALEAHGAGCVIDCAWSERRTVLFELMEFLHGAFHEKEIAADEYAQAAALTLDHVCALALAWEIPTAEFDPAGFRRNWAAVLAEIARPAQAPRTSGDVPLGAQLRKPAPRGTLGAPR